MSVDTDDIPTFLLRIPPAAGMSGSEREIILTRGFVTIVDDDLFDELSSFKWHVRIRRPGTEYAARAIYVAGAQKIIYMHNVVMPPPDGMVTDHINRKGLDNRRVNLRPATTSQNGANRVLPSGSDYRGVYRNPRGTRCWVAHITVHDSRKVLGYFEEQDEAARAYDRTARDIFGEFAVLNFPNEARP